MYGLIDCNNFFASCERAFNPALNGKPVVVLSNNDGCVIARSNEAKAMGIRMGVPTYQIREMIDKKQVYAFSSNYVLYGDMSARVMSILNNFVPEIEVYSIDEAFVNLSGIPDIEKFSRNLVDKITKSTGIPVSFGVAPTKTLAKIANRFAKKYIGYNQVCIIENKEKRIKALKLTPVGDVWGIGRKFVKKLEFDGVFTAYDFINLSEQIVRKKMTIIGERIWRELHGFPAIDLETIDSEKKQICTSRSFGNMVTDFDSLAEAVSTFAAVCAKKLREQKSCACSLMVFINTNRFRNDLPQWWQSSYITLPIASSDTMEIIHYSLIALKKIYATGFKYKKAGVILTEIVPQNAVQTNLFDNKDRKKSAKLMDAMDKINGYYQSNKVHFAIEGLGKNEKWSLRRELLSPSYTTKLDDIIKIKC